MSEGQNKRRGDVLSVLSSFSPPPGSPLYYFLPLYAKLWEGGSDDFFSRFLGPDARDSPNNKIVRSDELLKPDLWENPARVLSISSFSSRRRRLFSAMSLILEKISLKRGLEEEMDFLASPRMEKEKEEEGRGEGYKSAREKSLRV